MYTILLDLDAITPEDSIGQSNGYLCVWVFGLRMLGFYSKTFEIYSE